MKRIFLKISDTRLECQDEHPSLLAALESHNIDVEYQCRAGYCGSCRTRLVSGQVDWLTAGVGIAYVPLMWAIEEINRGELEILLPSYQSDPRPVYALYTEKDKLPLKVQVCINYLTEYFVDVAKIYQGMHGRGIAR